jgi:hypothetical protein
MKCKTFTESYLPFFSKPAVTQQRLPRRIDFNKISGRTIIPAAAAWLFSLAIFNPYLVNTCKDFGYPSHQIDSEILGKSLCPFLAYSSIVIGTTLTVFALEYIRAKCKTG